MSGPSRNGNGCSVTKSNINNLKLIMEIFKISAKAFFLKKIESVTYDPSLSISVSTLAR